MKGHLPHHYTGSQMQKPTTRILIAVKTSGLAIHKILDTLTNLMRA